MYYNATELDKHIAVSDTYYSDHCAVVVDIHSQWQTTKLLPTNSVATIEIVNSI